MPRKKSFNIKMIGREYGGQDDVPRSYTQSMVKFHRVPFGMILRSINRDHPYMRADGTKPLIHHGKAKR